MHPMLNIAVRAARIAGNLVVKYYDKPNVIKANPIEAKNFVTSIYREAEKLIFEVIHKSYPKHVIINDKNNFNKNVSKKYHEIQWIINSLELNSIANFIKSFPHFAISIAAQIKGRTEIAVVYDPIHNELFTASRGQGAQLNGYRLRCSIAKDLHGSILATSFSFNQKQYIDIYLAVIKKLFIKCADFRCTGSVALDLAYVAAGRVDGLFKIDLKPLNCIVGELLIREAGGLISDFASNHSNIFYGTNIISTVAGNPCIVKAILSSVCNILDQIIKY